MPRCHWQSRGWVCAASDVCGAEHRRAVGAKRRPPHTSAGAYPAAALPRSDADRAAHGGATEMRLLVTRPEAQAIEWVDMLRAQGVDAHALPLIAIEPQAEPAAAAAWVQLADHGLLVFVSPNAVARF